MQRELTSCRQVELDDLVDPLAAARSGEVLRLHEVRSVHDIDPVPAGDRDPVQPCLVDLEAHQATLRAVVEGRFRRLRGVGHSALANQLELVRLVDLQHRTEGAGLGARGHRLGRLFQNGQLMGHIPREVRAPVRLSGRRRHRCHRRRACEHPHELRGQGYR